MTTDNNTPPQEPTTQAVETPTPPQATTVTVETAPPETPVQELSHTDAQAVEQIAQETAVETVEPVVEQLVETQIETAENRYDIKELKEWQTTTNQTLETLTVGMSQMSETMVQILNLLQAQAQPTPPASENVDADDPAKTEVQETPAEQPEQTNRPEKVKEKRKRSWM